jgi:hypothetical protein
MVARMTSGGWINSHRCSWITVYVLCCNAQVNLIVIFMPYTCIAMHSLFCQLANCNLFSQHIIYLYGETPLVNCGPRSILLHIYYRLLSINIIYYLANKNLLPHDKFNPLFTANQWDWQPHCKLGQSTLVVLCAGSTLLTPVVRPAKSQLASTFRSGFVSPTGRLNLAQSRETCRCAHHTFLLGFPTGRLAPLTPGYRIDSRTIKRGFRLGNLIISS